MVRHFPAINIRTQHCCPPQDTDDCCTGIYLTGAVPREPDHQTTVVPEVCGPEVLGVGEHCLDVGPDGVVRLAGEVRPSVGDAVFPHFSRHLPELVARGLQEPLSPDAGVQLLKREHKVPTMEKSTIF